jgi:hypothetical protein
MLVALGEQERQQSIVDFDGAPAAWRLGFLHSATAQLGFLQSPFDPQCFFERIEIGPAKREDFVSAGAGECGDG